MRPKSVRIRVIYNLMSQMRHNHVFYIYFDLRKQNILITVSSYYFYGLWDWRFLSLLIIQTGSDYICAQIIDKNIDNQKIKKIALIFSITFNLGCVASVT